MFAIFSRLQIKRLKRKGLLVGKGLSIQNDVLIDVSHCHLIKIGNNVTLAPRVIILAHDASTKKILDYTKIGNVTIGDFTFVGAGSIILPNVNIGKNVIIGAGSVVTSDIPDNSVVVGNPARVIMSYDEYKEKNSKKLKKGIIYDEKFHSKNLNDKQKKQMYSEINGKIAFIK